MHSVSRHHAAGSLLVLAHPCALPQPADVPKCNDLAALAVTASSNQRASISRYIQRHQARGMSCSTQAAGESVDKTEQDVPLWVPGLWGSCGGYL